MSDIATLPAFQPLALFTVLLVLKMGGVAFYTAAARAKAKVVVNPEDTGVNPGSHVEATEAPGVLRAKRAHLNDLENIPAFLAVATLYTLAGGTSTGGWAYFAAYTVFRFGHTFCYIGEKQPWRTAMFFLGQLTLLGVMVNLLMLAF